MPRTARLRRPSTGAALAAAASIVALTVLVPGGAHAAKSGKSQNVKNCQKGGWRDLVRSDGSTFANQRQCVSYAAKGGQLQRKPTTLQVQCEQELAAAGLTAPPDANYILGTPGDDNFTSQMTAGNDVVCGFAGGDVIEGPFGANEDNDNAQLAAGDIFLGGAGSDAAYAVNGGTFNGGDGNDTVAYLNAGTFNGGADSDYVNVFSGGTFNGDAGHDRVGTWYGGTFNGGDGCDAVGPNTTSPDGTFNPGDQSTC